MVRIVHALLVALAVGLGTPLWAQDDALSAGSAGLDQAASEALLFEAIPMVITASKKEQLATQAPASVTVVTEEDIRRSGAMSIPDVLRRVVGLDVEELTASDWGVNARGLTGSLNPRMLVLIDGRTAYRDLYGGTIWYLLPVVLEDIERIEVVRGPGSALYGANAFSGVINIITKSVQAAAGTALAAQAGEDAMTRNSVVHASPSARVPYKVTAGYDAVDEWQSDEQSGHVGKLTFLLESRLGSREQLSLSGGWHQGSAAVRFSPNTRIPLGWDEHGQYLMATYERPELSVRTFWNHSDASVVSSVAPDGSPVQSDVLDIEAQTNREWGRHSVVLGAGARRTVLTAELIMEQPRHEENLLSLFGQDEYRLGSKWTLVGGVRLDHTALLGSRVSPRLTALCQASPQQVLRLTAGRAYRRPTFIEQFIRWDRDLAPGVVFTFHGNPDLAPEVLQAYEAEYRYQVNSRLKATAEVYRYYLNDLVKEAEVAWLPPPYPPYPIEGTLLNLIDARATGLELSAEYLVSPTVSCFANAAWERMVNRDTNQDLDTAPGHKLNVGVRYTGRDGWLGDMYLHHVGSTTWLLDSGDLADDYTLVNARVAKLLRDGDLELSVEAFNLFNDEHREFEDSPLLGRRISGTVRYRF